MTKIRRFAAIDFETADCGRDSACAVSVVVVVKKGKIYRREYALIRPPRQNFQFTWIHGISWTDVAEKARFGEIWPAIHKIIDGVDFIAAHNASFDRGVLKACCDHAGIKMIKIPFLCTVKLARAVWKIYPTKLPDVCRYLSIQIRHHNAGSDAMACAKIVNAALAEEKTLTDFFI